MGQPIDCAIHDYLEVACLYRYTITVTLKDESVIEGIAVTTRAAEGREFLVIDSNGQELPLDLQQLRRVVARTDGAMFDVLDFESQAD